jgi:hypothetical protein
MRSTNTVAKPSCETELEEPLREDIAAAIRREASTFREIAADEASRREYVAQVRRRLQAGLDAIPPGAEEEQYFPDDLFKLAPGEVFVDCGTYETRLCFRLRRDEFGGVMCYAVPSVNE